MIVKKTTARNDRSRWVAKPPLKVLFVIDGLWVGGTERSLAEMLPGLASAGIESTIVCFRHCADGVEKEVIRQGFDVRFIAAPGLSKRVLALRRLVESQRPAIVHSALFKSNLVARLACVGKPVVLLNSLVNTPYEPIRLANSAIHPGKVRLVQLLDGMTGRALVDHFHAVSHAVKASAIRTLRIPGKRITVVERGRDMAFLGGPSPQRRAEARRSLGLQPEEQLLLNIGRQDRQKGLSFLLKAFAAVSARHPRSRLLLAGRQGEATESLRGLRSQLGLESKVHFLGHRNDVPELLAAADLFVFPSLYEGLPGAVIEAMAMALPVIASDIPPVREVVTRNTALLVPPATVEPLAGAIALLLGSPDRMAEMGQRGAEVFQQRFRMERAVAGMVELYRTLVKGLSRKTAGGWPNDGSGCEQREGNTAQENHLLKTSQRKPTKP